jgi:hypothetical protein
MRLRAEIKEFAMSRNGSGVYSLPPGSTAVDDAIIDPVVFNTLISDLESDANTARPIVAGGTGATTAAAARSAIGAPPTPQTAAGAGQWLSTFVTDGNAAVLPAGGTWAWHSLPFTASTGTLAPGGSGGVNAGGTTVSGAVAGRVYVLMLFRIA